MLILMIPMQTQQISSIRETATSVNAGTIVQGSRRSPEWLRYVKSGTPGISTRPTRNCLLHKVAERLHSIGRCGHGRNGLKST
jgi:hypothetical protein